MPVTVLDREMYTQAAAARLLGLPQGTPNYWLEGGERRGKAYRPIIRAERRGDRAAVTWAEFVEAAYACTGATGPAGPGVGRCLV